MKGLSIAAAAVLLTMVGVVGALHLLFPGDASSMPPAAKKPQVAVKLNYDCYVCHMPFLEESLAAVHAKAAVWCGTCHGPSVAHIEDENIGATPPDIVFKRDGIDRMCAQCHDPLEHPKLEGNLRSERLAAGQKARQVVKGRKISVTGVCTDCHGSHWIPPREQQPRPRPGDGDAGTASAAPPQEDPADGARSNVSRLVGASERPRVFRRETAGRRVILPRRACCRLR